MPNIHETITLLAEEQKTKESILAGGPGSGRHSGYGEENIHPDVKKMVSTMKEHNFKHEKDPDRPGRHYFMHKSGDYKATVYPDSSYTIKDSKTGTTAASGAGHKSLSNNVGDLTPSKAESKFFR